ncbi:MAG: hypothetical protein IT377_22415 [Polyangiaceae bacterium]|nr:hypothetical protein [Polyangiaceae bacterium]
MRSSGPSPQRSTWSALRGAPARPSAWYSELALAGATCACLGCASAHKEADYVGDPRDMNDACTRAATVCPAGDDWAACHDDQWECHRLGLWYEDGIKVPKNPARSRRIFETMCDRFETGSCQRLCQTGDAKRCVDLALLGIAGAGGRPFPPSYDARDRDTFAAACRAGDVVACAMLDLRYTPARQRVVERVNSCFDDHARCFAAACDESDPLGCALLCHVGDALACSKLAALAQSGTGLRRPRPDLASRLSVAAPTDATYEFEAHEQPVGAILRKPKPAQRHVGEGLWSGWKTVDNIEGGAFGVTPLFTRAVGPEHHVADVSGLVGFFSEVYMRSWYPAHDKYLRFALGGEIGGGTAGLDGRVSHDAMVGFRVPFATRRSNPYSSGALYSSMPDQDKDALDQAVFTHSPHALFVRGGYSLRYSAVGSVLSSAVDLPRFELGYQFEGGDDPVRALDLRANAGLLLVGRFDVEEDEQPLGGAIAWGGAAVLHSRFLHTQLGVERIQGAVFGARPPLHRVELRSCLRIGGYLVCLQELLEHGSPGGSETTAWQAGAFVGFDGLD